MKKLSFMLFISLITFTVYGQSAMFTNPVIHGDMADPSIIRIDDTYYATGTSSEWAPFYPVYTSKDLINWEQTGHIFNEKPSWTSNSFWAPELFHHNGKVYCYYTARRKSDNISYIGVASAESPLHPFTDHGLLVEYGTEAIDAFIFDDNGQLYISWKAYGLDERPIELIASKLSDDGLSLVGEPFSLLKDDEGIGMEGQYHFKYGDYYYIIYAPHSCCGPGSDYDVYVARSKNFKGPYEKYAGNPILKGGGQDYISCGHGTIATSPDGRMFYMCHAYLNGDGFYAGRQAILQEMEMTSDDWVKFRTGDIAVIQQPMPYSQIIQNKVLDFEDTFKESTLKLDWAWNYPFSDADIKVQNGKLILSGTPKENNRYGTALCVRAKTPNYAYQTKIANKNGSLKGLTMYGDDKNLVVWGVSENKLILKSVRDNKEEILHESVYTDNELHLQINVEKGCLLSFSYSKNGKTWTPILDTPLDSKYLVRWDRVARLGLIHVGEPHAAAEFSYFSLKNSSR